MNPALKICLPSLATAFNAAAWNDPPLKGETNCYTYALNCPDMGWALPGQLTAEANQAFDKKTITVEAMRQRLEQDGLREITEAEAESGEFHAIALFIQLHEDFHFYRRDPVGIWSYKNGDQNISRFGDGGELITNPRVQHDRRYSVFGGYYAVPENGIAYRPRLAV